MHVQKFTEQSAQSDAVYIDITMLVARVYAYLTKPTAALWRSPSFINPARLIHNIQSFYILRIFEK